MLVRRIKMTTTLLSDTVIPCLQRESEKESERESENERARERERERERHRGH